jgi:O-succinylbenzoic acid--CoA ligase
VYLPNWLAQRAALTPHRPALILAGETLTFAELDERASSVDHLLADAGVAAGDRVATLYDSSGPFVVLVHALMRRRAILVPLNARLTAGELSWQLHAGADCLIFDRTHARLARGAAQHANRVRLLAGAEVGASTDGHIGARGRSAAAHSPQGGMDATTGTAGIPLVDLDVVHSIIYTAGTTGRPKGAMLTYGNHWWNAIGSTLNLGLQEDDRWLACLPLFHVGGLAILWRSVICGFPVVLHESFDPARVNRSIDTEQITIVSVVATMLQRMLAERGNRAYPPTLRCVLLGGGPAPLPLLQRCVRRGIPVFQTYGLTEAASQVATLAPEDALRKVGSAGKPLFPVQIRIDCTGAHASGPEPAVGEIVVRGPTVFAGYLGERNGVRAPAGRRDDEWFYTGDLGYLDDEGYLYVLDRRDDLIVSGGENVYPKEVEDVLLAHPAVADAGVYGVPDGTWGKVPVAAIVLRDGASATEAEVIRHCKKRLSRFKAPASIRIVERLPRNAAGKLQRSRLQESMQEL